MMPTYSIIIPVFNAEKYLGSCIDSVLNQSSDSSFEVILVNDGSTDRSREICDSYAQRYSNISAIHQTNQGVSAARNAGIAAANGVYVLFLDGDDCWEKHTLRLLDQLLLQEPDIIEFGYSFFDGKSVQNPVLPAVQVSGVTGEEYVASHEKRNSMPIGSSCTAAFQRQLLEDHEICFPLDISYGEDLDFHMHCLRYAESVFSICESLYKYRVNESSATHTTSAKKAQDMLSVCAKVYRLFPCGMLADYYCLCIPHIAKLAKNDAKQLNSLLDKNRDILHGVTGKSSRIARTLYGIFGWYYASKLIEFGINLRYIRKG